MITCWAGRVPPGRHERLHAGGAAVQAGAQHGAAHAVAAVARLRYGLSGGWRSSEVKKEPLCFKNILHPYHAL